MAARKSRLSCVHLIFDESFIFYDDKGRRLKQEKLVQYIDEELLKQKDVYIDTKVIAPTSFYFCRKKFIYIRKNKTIIWLLLCEMYFKNGSNLHGLHEFERNVKNLKNKGNALDFLSFWAYNYLHKWNILKCHDEDMSSFLRFSEREALGCELPSTGLLLTTSKL